ncbi:MFS transporter [Bacillus sp. SM2101]|uniref:MFS transporter n=1 Tax=Bacillus sp. SM2101 TaxID=2805366 RepID=UPI001BDDE9D0|nr:MFS transporter [Bacillus sp. SM2101]
MNQTTKVILFSAFCMNLAGFAVISFFAVYLSNTLYFSVVETGTVLSLIALTSSGLPLLTGGLGDKYGYKKLMGFGLLIRGTGFIILAMSESFYFVSCGAALIGVGSACYEPSSRAYFSSVKQEELKKRVFTYLNLSLNAGAIIGPLMGGVLLFVNPSYPFVISGIVFYILFVVQLLLVKRSDYTMSLRPSILISVKHIAKNKKYILYCVAMIFFWFMFSQLTVSIPLHMYNLTSSESYVSLVITVNAITGLMIMIMIKQLFLKMNIYSLLTVGVLTMSFSLLMISLNSSPYWLLICIIVFTIGETFVLPSSDIAISEFTSGQFQGSYFGFFEISFAIGATLGNFTGTYLMKNFSNSMFPWIIFSSVGVINFVLLTILKRTSATSPVMNEEVV